MKISLPGNDDTMTVSFEVVNVELFAKKVREGLQLADDDVINDEIVKKFFISALSSAMEKL